MAFSFFERPTLNSPYDYPGRHWKLDAEGQPTSHIDDSRRRSELITPVPKPKKRKSSKGQTEIVFKDGDGLSTSEQEYNPTPIINEVHWRHHGFHGMRPFFCQIEAVETAIWLTEVAPKLGARARKFRDHLEGANAQANPELFRIALKLATGTGKTTVMAMLIAWQTLNAVRHPGAKHFARGFLIVTPGITIRDRLRVLLPNDPDSYYAGREIVPNDMLADIARTKIVITNYHAFKPRERLEISSVGRALLKGRGPELQTLETEGQMLSRVCRS